MKYYDNLNESANYSVMLRPPMWRGVPYSIIPHLFFIEIFFYIGINPIYGIIALPFLWLMGFLLGRFDPDFAGVLNNRRMFWMNKVTDPENKIRSLVP